VACPFNTRGAGGGGNRTVLRGDDASPAVSLSGGPAGNHNIAMTWRAAYWAGGAEPEEGGGPAGAGRGGGGRYRRLRVYRRGTRGRQGTATGARVDPPALPPLGAAHEGSAGGRKGARPVPHGQDSGGRGTQPATPPDPPLALYVLLRAAPALVPAKVPCVPQYPLPGAAKRDIATPPDDPERRQALSLLRRRRLPNWLESRTRERCGLPMRPWSGAKVASQSNGSRDSHREIGDRGVGR